MNVSVVKWSILLVFPLIAACSSREQQVLLAEKSICVETLAEHVKVLASDEFQGRKPFTEGERKTIEYLAKEFEKIGLKAPYNGSYLQEVPMVGMTYHPSPTITRNLPKGSLTLYNGKDYLAKKMTNIFMDQKT